jgi:hypothetical protein
MLFIDKYMDVPFSIDNLVECFCSIIEEIKSIPRYSSSLGYIELPLVYFMTDFLMYDPHLFREYINQRIIHIKKYKDFLCSFRDVIEEIIQKGTVDSSMKKIYYTKKLAMKTADNNQTAACRKMHYNSKQMPYIEFGETSTLNNEECPPPSMPSDENYIKFMKYVIEKKLRSI